MSSTYDNRMTCQINMWVICHMSSTYDNRMTCQINVSTYDNRMTYQINMWVLCHMSNMNDMSDKHVSTMPHVKYIWQHNDMSDKHVLCHMSSTYDNIMTCQINMYYATCQVHMIT
jgi:hypothetical protein